MAHLIDQSIPYAALLIACIFATCTDIRSRKIPNAIPISLAVAALIYQAMHGPFALFSALAAMVAMLFCGTILFSFGWLGGGDIKFLAAGCALLPLSEAMYFVIFTAIGGGILALATATMRGTLRQTIAGSLMILHSAKIDAKMPAAPQTETRLPYAIAITFGALVLTFMHTYYPTGLRFS